MCVCVYGVTDAHKFLSKRKSKKQKRKKLIHFLIDQKERKKERKKKKKKEKKKKKISEREQRVWAPAVSQRHDGPSQLVTLFSNPIRTRSFRFVLFAGRISNPSI